MLLIPQDDPVLTTFKTLQITQSRTHSAAWRVFTFSAPHRQSGTLELTQSRTQRASSPAARRHSPKQLAHSPQRPRRVRSSFTGSLYRGNLQGGICPVMYPVTQTCSSAHL